MSTRGFIFRLASLQLVVWLQRLIRLILRISWLLAGITIVFVCLTSILKWSIPIIYYIGVSGFVLLAWLLSVFFPWPMYTKLTTKIDRNLDLKNQTATALQVVRLREFNRVTCELVADANRLLTKAGRRVALFGWHLLRDLLALLVMILLSGALAVYLQIPQSRNIPSGETEVLPPLGSDPKVSEIFPSGIPGLNDPIQEHVETPFDQLTAEQIDSLNVIASELGSDLSLNVSTYELGVALQQQNYRQAAMAMEQLASQLGSLSPETQAQIADALNSAGNALAETGIEPLASDMSRASRQIGLHMIPEISEPMDQLAADFHSLADALEQNPGLEVASKTDQTGGQGGEGASPGGGSPETGNGFERILGEGQQIELGMSDGEAGLLSPGQTELEDVVVLGGDYSLVQLQDIDFSTTFLIPYQYDWEIRDVVEKYFSR